MPTATLAQPYEAPRTVALLFSAEEKTPGLDATAAPDPGAAGTISTAVRVARTAPAAARAGIILSPGLFTGQKFMLINEAAAVNTLTAAAAGTSNVANGVSTVVAGLTAQQFVWDANTSLWYPM